MTRGSQDIDAMANDYSRRAREARVTQGKPLVIAEPGVLLRLAEIIAADSEKEAQAS